MVELRFKIRDQFLRKKRKREGGRREGRGRREGGRKEEEGKKEGREAGRKE